MTRQELLLSLCLSLVSFIHLATTAPTERILVSHEDFKHNPVFDPSRYSSISEWLFAQGRILEIANNATKECLSHLSVGEDNSVCFGDDKWEWNAVAVICVAAILAAMIVPIWLCWDWAQTSILWLLGDEREEFESSSGLRPSPVEKQSYQNQPKLKEMERRVDSVHSHGSSGGLQAKVTDKERRIISAHSRTKDDDLLAMPALVGDGATSRPPAFQDSDNTLRILGWLH